jgi:HEAT repeat protein
MKRRTWVVLGGAAVGMLLALITHRHFRSGADSGGHGNADPDPVVAAVNDLFREHSAGAPAPSPESMSKLKELGSSPRGKEIVPLVHAWLRRLYDEKRADSTEFRELIQVLMTADPSEPSRAVMSLRTASVQGERDYQVQLLIAFGKPALACVLAAFEEDARNAGNNFQLAAKSLFPGILATLGPDALTALRAELKHKDAPIRRQALRALALMGRAEPERTGDAVPDVETALKDKDAAVRAFAALAWAEWAQSRKNDGPPPALVNLLNDSDDHVRLAAARTLGPLRSVDIQHVALVVADLLKSEPFKQTWWNVVGQPPTIAMYAAQKGGQDYSELFWDETAAHVLLGLGPRHQLPPEVIVEMLRHCPYDGRHLITLLAAQGMRATAAVPELAKMVKDSDYLQRRKGLIALGQLGKTVAVDGLPEVVGALDHKDGRTRWQAFLTLMQLDPAIARDRLPASLHAAINAASSTFKRTNLSGVSHWTRCLWFGSASVLVPVTNANADVDALGLYRTPTDWDIVAENDRIDQMLAALNRPAALPGDAVPFLMDVWLSTGKEEVSAILVKMGKAAVPGLRAHMKGDNLETWRHAVDALGLIGAEAAPALPDLIALFQTDNQQLRVVAVRAVGRIGKPALEPLTAALKNSKDSVRLSAVRALTLLHEEARPALPALRLVAENDSSAETRSEAGELVNKLEAKSK